MVAWNGVTTGIFNGGPQAAFFRGSNPFAAPNILEYGNARDASYGSAGSTATLLAPAVVAPVFAGGSSMLSVVPQNTSLFRAVSRAELDDIMGAGSGFRPNPNGSSYETGKLFTRSAEEAAQFGRNNFRLDGQPFYIVETEAPAFVMRSSFSFTADSMRAVSVPTSQLRSLSTPRTFSFCSTCPR